MNSNPSKNRRLKNGEGYHPISIFTLPLLLWKADLGVWPRYLVNLYTGSVTQKERQCTFPEVLTTLALVLPLVYLVWYQSDHGNAVVDSSMSRKDAKVTS